MLGTNLGTGSNKGAFPNPIVVGQYIQTPLFPETVKPIGDMTAYEIWTRYIRYLGAGGVAAGGILTIIRSIPTMISSFKVGMSELTRRAGDRKEAAAKEKRTDKDLSFKTVLIGSAAIVLAIATLPFILSHVETFAMRLVADSVLQGSESFASPGLKYLKWLQPLRPGDSVSLLLTVLDVRRSSKRPDLGIVQWRWQLRNQQAIELLELEATSMFKLEAEQQP